MNYELAKKLEVAGFYQPKGKDIFKGEYLYINPKCFKSAVYNPTLEELIDACGGKARVLMTKGEGDGWAYAVDGNGASGKTPIEAVANLWLKLIK